MITALLLSALLSAPASAGDGAPDARFSAAVRLYAAQKYPEATAEFRAISSRKGADPLARVALTLGELHLGRTPLAAKTFLDYADEVRGGPELRGGGAMSELKVVSIPFLLFGEEPGRPELLKKLGDELTGSAPSDPLGAELVGFYGLQAGDKPSLDSAAALLKTSFPRSPLGPFFAGFSATLSRDRDAARRSFSDALALEPNFEAARAAYSQVVAGTDDAVDPLARAQARLIAAFGAAAALFAAFRLRAAFSRPA